MTGGPSEATDVLVLGGGTPATAPPTGWPGTAGRCGCWRASPGPAAGSASFALICGMFGPAMLAPGLAAR